MIKRILIVSLTLAGLVGIYALICNQERPLSNLTKEDSVRVMVVSALPTCIEGYHKDTGHYPTTEEGLDALIHKPANAVNWHGPYVTVDSIPKDPWGREYRYASPGIHHPESYDVWSLGSPEAASPDKVIGNWE